MSQAKCLTATEIEQVLAYVATRRFALRNRVMFLTSTLCGMRVGEIASLKIGDVLNADGVVKDFVHLTVAQTKGRHPRTVLLPQKLQAEIQRYMDIRRVSDFSHPLFVTAGGKAFSANVMAQHFFWQYRKCGIVGASSHSGRRSFLTTLANKGISIHILASLAGHRSVNVTMKYLTANDEMKRNAVNLI
ncbi:MAG: site-specific integrase [Burkholderiales bacterium]|nr:site-specific integrase [Burkholderiales bacterium]